MAPHDPTSDGADEVERDHRTGLVDAMGAPLAADFSDVLPAAAELDEDGDDPNAVRWFVPKVHAGAWKHAVIGEAPLSVCGTFQASAPAYDEGTEDVRTCPSCADGVREHELALEGGNDNG